MSSRRRAGSRLVAVVVSALLLTGTAIVGPGIAAAAGGAPTVTQVSAGAGHTCAVASGGVWCWGDDASGQLGDGTTTSRSTPAPVAGLPAGATGVSAGADHTCAVASGEAWCWGNGSLGQLGDGTTTSRSTPAVVPGLPLGVTQVAAGLGHTCAVASGEVWCWGDNRRGQLGDGTTTDRPIAGPGVRPAPGVTGSLPAPSTPVPSCRAASGAGGMAITVSSVTGPQRTARSRCRSPAWSVGPPRSPPDRPHLCRRGGGDLVLGQRFARSAR